MNTPPNIAETAAANCMAACRTQFETGLALVGALAAGSERVREVQLAAARDAQAQTRRIAESLAKATTPQELLTLQGSLVNDYCLGALRYWTSLAELAQRTQVEMAGVLQKKGGQALAQAQAEAPAAAFPGSTESFAYVMQTAFDAARGANEAFVKALTGAYQPAAAAKKSSKAADARPAG